MIATRAEELPDRSSRPDEAAVYDDEMRAADAYTSTADASGVAGKRCQLERPLVWVPYMAWALRKSGLQMGRRASAFYADRKSEEAGVTVRKAPTVRIAMSAGFVRMLLLIALPIVVAVIALLFGADIGTGRWISAGIFLIVVSALATLGWFAYRWWRRRRVLGKSAGGRPSVEV